MEINPQDLLNVCERLVETMAGQLFFAGFPEIYGKGDDWKEIIIESTPEDKQSDLKKYFDSDVFTKRRENFFEYIDKGFSTDFGEDGNLSTTGHDAIIKAHGYDPTRNVFGHPTHFLPAIIALTRFLDRAISVAPHKAINFTCEPCEQSLYGMQITAVFDEANSNHQRLPYLVAGAAKQYFLHNYTFHVSGYLLRKYQTPTYFNQGAKPCKSKH